MSPRTPHQADWKKRNRSGDAGPILVASELNRGRFPHGPDLGAVPVVGRVGWQTERRDLIDAKAADGGVSSNTLSYWSGKTKKKKISCRPYLSADAA